MQRISLVTVYSIKYLQESVSVNFYVIVEIVACLIYNTFSYRNMSYCENFASNPLVILLLNKCIRILLISY